MKKEKKTYVRKEKDEKRTFIAALFMICCLGLILTGCGSAGSQDVDGKDGKALLKDCPLIHEDNSSGVFLQISIDDFNALGFEYGDSVDIEFSNGYKMEDIPYFNGYYGEALKPLLVSYPGEDNVKAAFNYGEDLWNVARLKKSDTVSISIHEKGAYLEEQEAGDIHYSSERDDYPNDEVFANFREVTAGKIKKGLLCRSASPCDNKYKRASCADGLAAKARIKCIVDLADGKEELEEFVASEDFDSPYFKDLWQNNSVIPLSLSMNYLDERFHKTLAEGLTAMANEEGPYLIHCLEGKDRTGFVCILIEALCGASYQEIADDYMLTYENYYGISEETDPEKYDTIKGRNLDAMLKEIVSDESVDISKADLSGYAKDYMLRIGMNEENIDQLRDKLFLDK